jgi:predicted Zn-ribbon and HTH transcriptional regulator
VKNFKGHKCKKCGYIEHNDFIVDDFPCPNCDALIVVVITTA